MTRNQRILAKVKQLYTQEKINNFTEIGRQIEVEFLERFSGERVRQWLIKNNVKLRVRAPKSSADRSREHRQRKRSMTI